MLGLPLYPKKCEGPCTSLVVLGIELDSVNQIARLPNEKLLALRQLLQSWVDRRWCNKERAPHLSQERAPHPPDREFRLDLQWWQHFLDAWHGVSFWHFPGMSAATDLEVTSDAAGSIGYGAYFYDEWFQRPVVSRPSSAVHCVQGAIPCCCRCT